jgi:AcrR family transcriptional regulator
MPMSSTAASAIKTNRRGPASDGRERVLMEAQRLFVTRGFAEVSMQQIAEAAGMTKAALYYHFHHKEDLFLHVIEREISRLRSGLDAGIAGQETTRGRLAFAAQYLLDHVRGDFGRLMGDMKQHLSNCDHPPGGGLPFQAVESIFADAVARGELRPGLDAADLTPCFVGMIFAQAHRDHIASGRPVPSRTNAETAAFIADLVLNGAATG